MFRRAPQLFTGRHLCTKAPAQQGWKELYQIDAGFYQGGSLLAASLVYTYGTSKEFKMEGCKKILQTYRSLGVKEDEISAEKLLKDYVYVNSLAAVNVLLASPAFYSLFHYMHGSSVTVSAVRGLTGSVRIVPFMGFFYGALAAVGPFATAAMMKRGYDYDSAKDTAGPALILSGFVAIEGVVELRGCGVTFQQMTLSSFAIFLPALIGRLAAGVLTQQQKVGSEDVPLLPPAWGSAGGVQQWLYEVTNRFHVDKDFFTTVGGTSVFQHILNAVTFVLLSKGKATKFRDIFGYLGGGLDGSRMGALLQFGRTCVLRLGFCFTWNYCSAQKVVMPAIEAVIEDLEREQKEANEKQSTDEAQ